MIESILIICKKGLSLFFVKKDFEKKLEVKKSNFIAYLTPIKQFKSLQSKLRVEHPKANHIVWATRYLNEFDQVVENCSDDGEPKGTSGPPVLNVMRGCELIECGILIVRYFGGIKLGTGGLVRAYGSSAKEVIEEAQLEPYVKKTTIQFHTSFSLISRFEHYFENSDCEQSLKEFDSEGALWSLDMSERQRTKFLEFALCFELEGFKLITP